jgi:hypothetical protein
MKACSYMDESIIHDNVQFDCDNRLGGTEPLSSDLIHPAANLGFGTPVIQGEGYFAAAMYGVWS